MHFRLILTKIFIYCTPKDHETWCRALHFLWPWPYMQSLCSTNPDCKAIIIPAIKQIQCYARWAKWHQELLVSIRNVKRYQGRDDPFIDIVLTVCTIDQWPFVYVHVLVKCNVTHTHTHTSSAAHFFAEQSSRFAILYEVFNFNCSVQKSDK